MRVFARVAELGSFTKAGLALRIPKASVSLAVQELEAQLGARLLNRTTRTVKITQDGIAFFERCLDLLADLDEVQSMFARSPRELKGRVRCDMPAGVATNLVLPALPSFLAEHPHIELELSATDRKVDVLQEGFDCVLRIGANQETGLIAKRLGFLPLINCASASYVAKMGLPERPEELSNHALIHYVANFGGKLSGFFYQERDREYEVGMQGHLVVNNGEAYLAACLAGIGIVQIPEIAVRKYLATGELVEILPKQRAPSMPVVVLYPHRRHLPARVRVLIDWLGEIMGKVVEQPAVGNENERT